MLRKSIGNKIMTAIMVLMVLITGIGISDTVIAGNTDDTDWEYQLYAEEGIGRYMTRREKYDDSKIYINWTAIHSGNVSSFYVAPYGARGITGELESASNLNDTNVKKYIIPSQGKYSITNFVHEKQCTYATLRVWGKTGTGYAVGKWSPDSTRNYTVVVQFDN